MTGDIRFRGALIAMAASLADIDLMVEAFERAHRAAARALPAGHDLLGVLADARPGVLVIQKKAEQTLARVLVATPGAAPALRPEPCCHRDNDGDGNCAVHSAPGVLRRPR